MSEKETVYHATKTKLLGLYLENRQTSLFHAYHKDLPLANLTTNLAEAWTLIYGVGEVLEFAIPITELIEIDTDVDSFSRWYSSSVFLHHDIWNEVPVSYRHEMVRAGLIGESEIYKPENWSKEIVVSVVNYSYLTKKISR